MLRTKTQKYTACLHFDGFCDRVQIGQVDHGHGRRLFENAAELNVETVGGGHCGRTNGHCGRRRDGRGLSCGDSHDLGLRVPVATNEIGHCGRAAAATAVFVVVVVVVGVPQRRRTTVPAVALRGPLSGRRVDATIAA